MPNQEKKKKKKKKEERERGGLSTPSGLLGVAAPPHPQRLLEMV
jgi:hypothetical protein